MAEVLEIVRAIYFVATLQLFGSLLSQLVLTQTEIAGRAFYRLIAVLAALAVVALLAWLPLEAASISDESLRSVLHNDTIGTVLEATRFGHLWIARVVLLLVLALVLPWQKRHFIISLGCALAGGALGLSAASGHAGATPSLGGNLHLAGDVIHLLAVGAWIGGLLPFALTVSRHIEAGGKLDSAIATASVQRFSLLGIVCVAAILATGLINSWFLVGNVPALIGTDYGRLLLVKLFLFVVIVAIAAINRLYLAPKVALDKLGILNLLRRNALIEVVLGVAIVAIVAVLGTLPPAAHDQPVWPLSFRIAFNPYPVVVNAYPTSFIHSPIAYAAPSITRGASVYTNNCLACHGPTGRGNGPAAARLPVRPADFTAHNLFAHLDGELFWWVSHGIGGGMPAFMGALSEADRWNVINFIRALNASAGAQKLTTQPSGNFAPLLPDFYYRQRGQVHSLAEVLQQSDVLLVLTGDNTDDKLQAFLSAQQELRLPRLRVIAIATTSSAVSALGTSVATVDPHVAEMLSLFLRKPSSGVVYLVDANSYLRARWTSPMFPSEADLIASVSRMRAFPIARQAEHHH